MAFNVLTNKYVFYVLLVIGVANLLGYLAMEDYESLTLFVAIYALATYFSKNTIVNLSAAILGTAVVRTPVRRKAWPWKEREGFEGQEGGAGIVAPGLQDVEAVRRAAMKTVKRTEGFEGEEAQPATENEEEREVKSKNLMALGSNLQSQLDRLNGTLGKGGAKPLAQGTGELALQQKELMEHMANMGPLMENAEKLLKTFERSGLMRMVEKIAPLVEKVALPGMGAAKR